MLMLSVNAAIGHGSAGSLVSSVPITHPSCLWSWSVVQCAVCVVEYKPVVQQVDTTTFHISHI